MIERYVRAMDALYRACIWTSGFALVVMTVVIPWGVYARYVLGTGSQWPEPLAILMMVLFTFAAAAACYRAESHIAVRMLTDRLPARVQPHAARLVDLVMAGLCLFMVIWGFELCYVTWFQVIPEFPWLSVGITYLPLPVGGVLTLFFIVERLLAGSQAQRPVVTFDHEPPVAGRD